VCKRTSMLFLGFAFKFISDGPINMASFLKFRNQIFKYSILVAIIMEVVSFAVFGLSSKFLLGLVAGTAVTIVNFTILERSAAKLVQKNSKGPVVAGYFLRLPIYGVVFYVCLMAGMRSAIGCALGFVTLPLALIYIYGIKSRFPGAEKNPLNDWTEPKEWNDSSDWDDDDDDWGPLPKWTDKKKK
jgi:ATP synthase I chain